MDRRNDETEQRDEPEAGETDDFQLSSEEREEVGEHQRLKATVVFTIVQRDGEAELARPVLSLWWSGIAAGIGISASILAEGLLHHHLPDTPSRPVLENLGYCFGFVIVIMGRLQLFTENTLTAVLPLLISFTRRRLWCTARLWAVVLAANLVGTFFTALLAIHGGTVKPEYVQSMLEISRPFGALGAGEALLYGIPAGFFVAAIVWMIPSAESATFAVIVSVTYLIALGDFAHVVAGSAEVFLLQLNGELGVARGLAGILLPTLVGNVIGGTGLFALLAYGQVREETAARR